MAATLEPTNARGKTRRFTGSARSVRRRHRNGRRAVAAGGRAGARGARGRRIEARVFELADHVPAVEAVGALGVLDARIGELEEGRHRGVRSAEERFGHLVLRLVAVGETEPEV